MRAKYLLFVLAIAVLLFAGAFSWNNITPIATVQAQGPTPTPDAPSLDPNTIPKFVNQLEKPGMYVPRLIKDRYGKVIRQEYTVSWGVTDVQILPPGFPKSRMLAYGGLQVPADNPNATPVFRRTVPGATFELTRNLPVTTHWRNEFDVPQFLAVDPLLDRANPNGFVPPPCPPFLPFPPGYAQAQFPIPDVTHTHGIEVRAKMDGTPDEWFTFTGITGPNFLTRDYDWPVTNESSAFWYHDHAFGLTRVNVYSGLFGFHIVRDPNNPLDKPNSPLPKGKYEMQLGIKDYSFNQDGSIFYPHVGGNPNLFPYWNLGGAESQTNTVNGKIWPNMNVERHQYRFRFLNASNGRIYQFQLSNGMPFTIIGTDGGYRETPAVVTSFVQGVTERYDVLIDFSGQPVGTKIILQNTGQDVPPVGPPPDPNTEGIVMQFTVVDSPVVTPAPLPAQLNTIARLTPNAPPRILTQVLKTDATGNVIQLYNEGLLFHDAVQEFPQIGSTDLWQFANAAVVDHVKHIHLIQYQVQDRQPFDSARYRADWLALNGPPPFDHPTIKLPLDSYLTGTPIPPRPEEDTAWKDSVVVNANFVTRLKIRWAPQHLPTGAGTPGVNDFTFNPFEVGYVWHCHILEHEDNEMMRQLITVPYPNYPDWFIGTAYNVGDKVRFGNKQYEAIQANVASQANRPDVTPEVWKVITTAATILETPVPLCTQTPTPTPTPTPAIKVQFYNGNRTASINTLYPRFKVVNTGTVAVPLSSVKVRYYYTIDGEYAQTFHCDYSNVGISNVTGTLVKMSTPKTGADYYLEVGFTSAAGNLAPGAFAEAQCRVNKNNWALYTQTNDYSFNATATSYVDWTKVTGWISGVLKWGTEP